MQQPPDHSENWSIGDTLALDNDGDGLFDVADNNCSPSAVPALSDWGLVTLVLGVILTGTSIFRHPAGPTE